MTAAAPESDDITTLYWLAETAISCAPLALVPVTVVFTSALLAAPVAPSKERVVTVVPDVQASVNLPSAVTAISVST